MKTKKDFLHSIGYLNCTGDHVGLDLLLILAHARLPSCQNYWPLVLLLSEIMLLSVVRGSVRGPVEVFLVNKKFM